MFKKIVATLKLFEPRNRSLWRDIPFSFTELLIIIMSSMTVVYLRKDEKK